MCFVLWVVVVLVVIEIFYVQWILIVLYVEVEVGRRECCQGFSSIKFKNVN